MKMDSLIFLGSLIFYLSALVFYGLYLFSDRKALGRWWILSILIGFSLHTLVMVHQALLLIQSALINLFEILVLFSWALVCLGLLLQSRIRLRILLGIILIIVLALGTFSLGIPRYFSKSIPSLNAFWFGTHILLSLLGYAAFAVALVSGLFYLFLDRQLKLKRSGLNRLPPLEVLEWINFRSLWVGAILLGLGLVSGFVWVKWAGVTLTLKDPKVIAAWLTLGIYGLILYVRSTARWRGRKVAYLTVLGFSSVLVTFFVMNYFSKGHGFF